MVNVSAYERTLVFSNLHTSHGGQYTCRAALGQSSAVASTELSVQSACVKLMGLQDAMSKGSNRHAIRVHIGQNE